MTRIKNYFTGNNFRLRVLLAVLVLVMAGAPAIYAQFIRQDGDPAGWGYGYGYGYGAGYGWDEGNVAGYRSGGGNLDQYGYGYGYGNMTTGQDYDAEEDLYTFDIADVAELYTTGLVSAVATDGGDTVNSFTFVENTQLDISADITVTIPGDTTFTRADDETMTDDEFFTLTGSIPTVSGLDSDYTSEGSVAFGIPTFGITASQAVTIVIGGLDALDGEELTIFHQAPGSSDWTELTTCTVASGLCTFTATQFSSFSAASYDAPAGGGGGGGGAMLSYCTAVTYGDWGSCTASMQYRNILTQTPTSCSLTTTQYQERMRACTVTADGTIIPVVSTPGTSDVVGVMNAERLLVKKVNIALTTRLIGRILLQVEEKGQSWYVEPISRAKYFMGRPADAFDMMRRFGLGITNANLATFEKNGVPAKYAGRIFLKVQAHGEAYYVNPVNMKMYFLGRPADAFRIMRELGLGITNANIRQIQVGK